MFGNYTLENLEEDAIKFDHFLDLLKYKCYDDNIKSALSFDKLFSFRNRLSLIHKSLDDVYYRIKFNNVSWTLDYIIARIEMMLIEPCDYVK